MIHSLNFIKGQFVAAIGGKTLDNFRPDTGAKYGTLPSSAAVDVEQAVAAARTAAPQWSSLSPQQRGAFMNKIADAVEENLLKFAEAESRDQGKPVSVAKAVDIPRVITNFRFFAGQACHMEEAAVEFGDRSAFGYVLRRPCGVAALVTPWNYPLYLATWKIAPAIAAGNTCVIKPSELTPVTIGMLCEVFQAVGLPAGVVNVVHGTGSVVGDALVRHPDIDCISFTGGTVTGRAIATAAPLVKKSFELGGKNASIVFADAKLSEAVEGCVRASFLNQGQVCNCNARILVQKSIYEEFKARFVTAVKAIKVGPPGNADVFMGPLISRPHLDKIQTFIDAAVRDGGRLLCGNEPLDLDAAHSGGYYLRPHVFEGLGNQTTCNQSEIFGPLATLQSFDTEADAVQLANATPYGLGCSLWTENGRLGHRLAGEIKVGSVWINGWLLRDWRLPFGGVKASGPGREAGKYAIDFYTDLRTVYAKL